MGVVKCTLLLPTTSAIRPGALPYCHSPAATSLELYTLRAHYAHAAWISSINPTDLSAMCSHGCQRMVYGLYVCLRLAGMVRRHPNEHAGE